MALDKKFHPRNAGHMGSIVIVGGERLYFTGDTEPILEIKRVRCDVASLPVSGTYVMMAAEAMAVFNDIQPPVAVPMHYGAGVAGSQADRQAFKDQVGAWAMLLAPER